MIYSNKMVNKKHILVFVTFALLIATLLFVSAIPSFTHTGWIENPDNFYSPYETWVNVSVSVANDSGGYGTIGIDAVLANFTAINNTACDGTGYLNLTYTSGGTWTGGCNVSSFFTNTSQVNPIPGNITFVAINSSGDNVSTSQPVIIVMHNLGVPPTGPCMQWGSSTTNFSTVTNFAAVNFVLQHLANLSCVTPGGIPPGAPGWTSTYETVALINFTSINLSTPQQAQKLQELQNAMQVSLTPPHLFGDSRIYFNTTYFAELNTSTSITLYHLPFTSRPPIIADAGAAGYNSSTVVWAQGVGEGNLTFTVYGFSGYNITDSVVPTISVVAPGTAKNLTNFILNVSVNGTGTELNLIKINITNSSGQVNYTLYNASDGTNTANCSAISSGSELYYCTLNMTLAEGIYTVNVNAWDYGGVSPGNTNSLSQSLTIDATTPDVTLKTPADNGDWTSSNDVDFKFNVTDISIANCSLIIDDTTEETDTSITVSTTQTITFNLDDGTYDWKISCIDYAGHTDTSSEWTVTVDYTESSGGDGGGTPSTSFWTNSYYPTDQEAQEGFAKLLNAKERIRVKVGTESHYVGIIALTSSSATINISSTPQQAVFNVGETKSFEVNDDGYYDIKVKLNSVSSTTANVTVWSIYEQMPSTQVTGAAITDTGAEDVTTDISSAYGGVYLKAIKSIWFWVGFGVVILVAAGAWYYLRRRKRIKGY